MILVSGATGQLGQTVVEHLLNQGAKGRFALLVRDPAKAKGYIDQGIETREGDFDNPEMLQDAFGGIDRFLFISTMSHNRGPQQIAVVDAAKRAGVKQIIYTGLGIRDINTSAVKTLMTSHFETEDRIRGSGMEWTFLRNSMYADAIPQIIGPSALRVGIRLPGGSGRVPYALRSEMGEAAANVLLQAGHSNKAYTITGNEGWSYADIAAALSRLTGRHLIYENIAEDELRAQLSAAGMPDFLVWLTLGTVQDIREGQYDLASRDLEKLLGRAPASLDNMLRALLPQTNATTSS